MNSYYAGQTVRLSVTVNVLGTPMNPTGITLTLTPPDGSAPIVYPTPVHDGTGLYHQDVVTAAPYGTWAYGWASTGYVGVTPPSGFIVNALP